MYVQIELSEFSRRKSVVEIRSFLTDPKRYRLMGPGPFMCQCDVFYRSFNLTITTQ